MEQLVADNDGKVIWIGAPVDLTTRAADERSILLGYINGPFAAYIDGELVLMGNTLSQSLPVTVPLSEKFLARKTIYLALAIEIHRHKTTFPFQLNIRSGGEGLVNAQVADWRRVLSIFLDMTMPMSLVVAHVMIALLFFYFWVTARRKHEYFYLSIFSLVHALIQTRHISFVFLPDGFATTYYLDAVLRAWEGAFAFAFALSFARTRTGVIKYVLPAMILLPFSVSFFPGMSIPRNLQILSQWIATYWVVLLYGAGSFALGFQVYELHKTRPTEADALKRKKRLANFTLAFALNGLIYAAHSWKIASFANYLWFYRVAHLGILVFVAYIVVSEYRELNEVMDRVFINRYIKELIGRTAIHSGVLLRFDLKQSKAIAQEYVQAVGSGSVGYHTAVSLWVNQAIGFALERGGVLLREPQGDEALIFFDNVAVGDPLGQAVASVDHIFRFSRDLFQGLLGVELANSVEFRASVCGGEYILEKNGVGKVDDRGDVLVVSKQDLEREASLMPQARSRLIVDRAALSYSKQTRMLAEFHEKTITDKAGSPKTVLVKEYPEPVPRTSVGV